MSTLRFETFAGHWIKKGFTVRVPSKGAISFNVNTGSWIFVTGKNGTGKTTLFDAICGFADLVTGEMCLDEQLIDLGSVRSRFLAGFQYVFQCSYFEDNLLWKDAIDLMRLNREGLYNSEAISDLHTRLSSAGLIKDDSVPITPRVFDLIIALSSIPSVLILDEISFPLYTSEAEMISMYKLIRELAPMATVFFSEHNSQIGAKMADYIIWLKEGEESEIFSVQDKKSLNVFLSQTDESKKKSLVCGNLLTRDWDKVIKTNVTPYKHIDLVIRFCTKQYYKAVDTYFGNHHQLKTRLFLDFPFLAEDIKKAGYLSGGQKIILAWFLLDFTGIGSVPESEFKHLDPSNKQKIKFWSKVSIRNTIKI